MTDRFPTTIVATAAQQGMVRIHRGAELRYVWPVHLAGWLSSGWQLGDDSRGRAADALVATPITAGATATAPVSSSSTAPTATSQPASAPERDAELLDAHLPTNLLDPDLEPEAQPAASIIATTTAAAPPEAALQNASERNDASSALFADSEPLADAPAGIEGLVADTTSQDAPAESALEEVTAAAAATDPSPEAPQAPDPQQAQAPARRGRPRKARHEAQPEPEAQSEAEAPEQEQAPASPLFSAGDDPFGIDPLL